MTRKAWWRGAPPIRGKVPRDPAPDERPDPRLVVGARVRLLAMPERERRITDVLPAGFREPG